MSGQREPATGAGIGQPSSGAGIGQPSSGAGIGQHASGAGIGHNGGPGLGGTGWQLHCWRQARRGLLGERLPIEVIRRRVARAQDLGLPYKTYASIRASSGRDVVGFLFSTNALRAHRDHKIAEDRARALAALARCDRIALVQRPLDPAQIAALNPALDATHIAPDLTMGWGATARAIIAAKGSLPAAGVVMIGDTSLEAEWAEAGKLAGYLPADAYFPASAA